MRTIRLITALAGFISLVGLGLPVTPLLAQSGAVALDLELAPATEVGSSALDFSVHGTEAATGAPLVGETVAIGSSDPAVDAPDQVVLSIDGQAGFTLTAGEIDDCRTIEVKAVLRAVDDAVTTEICPETLPLSSSDPEEGYVVSDEGPEFGTVQDPDEEEPGWSDGGGDMASTDVDPSSRGNVLSLTVDPTTVVSGEPAKGRVELDAMEITAADATPVSVSIESGDPAVVKVPAEITTNESNTTFPVETGDVPAERSVTITARSNGTSASASLVVRPLAIEGVSMDPSQLRPRQRGVLTVRLNAPVSLATIVDLSTNQPGLLSLPSEVEIAEGDREARVRLTATAQRLPRPVRAVVTATMGAGKAASAATAVVVVSP